MSESEDTALLHGLNVKLEVTISMLKALLGDVTELKGHVKETNGRLSDIELQEAETRGSVMTLRYMIGVGIAVAGLVLTAIGILTAAIISSI